MPFGGLLTAAIIGGVSTIAGSAISGKKKETPSYTPGQSQIQNQLQGNISDRLAHPNVNLDPLQATATGEINQNYTGLKDRLQRDNVDRGFGRSGTLASNDQALELSRQGDLGSLASRFAGYQIDQQNKTVDQAQNFAFTSPGQTTTQGGGVGGALGGIAGLASGFLGTGGFGGGPGGGTAGTPGQILADQLGGN